MIELQKPISVAQAWSAPIVMCLIGLGFAIWGFRVKPEASDVTAALVIMIVGPATAAALIARGLVGLYQKAHWRGSVAIVAGVVLFVGLIMAFNAVPWRGDSSPQW
jgi:hypothetical protein